MTGVSDLLPVLGLRLRAGRLELRGIRDDDLAVLADLAVGGIHPADQMPFYSPWSTAPAEELPRNLAQYHWRARATFSPAAWNLELGVWWDGVLVGCQELSTENYLVTRTGETGSWLGQEHQGKGIGTAMRQAICALAFDHLGAAEVTSGAFSDNPASLAVSRRVGYVANGTRRIQRREGELAELQLLVLTPDRFVRGDDEPVVDGIEPFRRSIGL